MGTVTLLRHGRTDANALGLLQGRVDNPLDSAGLAQAARAAEVIGPVTRIISSPLLRAQQTAAAFAESMVLDERWAELDYGEWDGLPIGDLPPGTWDRWKADLDLRPPGGETLRELSARVRAALDALQVEPDEHVLVVSHVSPIKAGVAWALGVDDSVAWRTHLTTGSYCTVRLGGAAPVLTAFNVIP